MPSEEQLISIRSLTGEARSKANETVDQYKERRYRHKYQSRMRMNKISALSACSFDQKKTFEVPSHSQICGELMLCLDLPALDGQNYKPYAALRCIRKITLRAGGNQFYEYKPLELMPLLINRVRDSFHKQKLKNICGNSAATASGRVMIPIITPWSVWHNDAICEPLDHGVRGATLWDGARLTQNLVVEVEFASKAELTTSASSAFQQATSFGDADLYWEELVASKPTKDAIRAQIPTTVYCDEFTRKPGLTINGDGTALTSVNVSALTSRAGTKGFYFRVCSQAEYAADDPFVSDARLRAVKLDLDGRQVYDNSDQTAEVIDYQRLLAGERTTISPNYAHFTFGNDDSAAFHAQTYSGLLKNQAVNETVLEIAAIPRDPATAMVCDVYAQHPRQFTFTSGTVRASNCY